MYNENINMRKKWKKWINKVEIKYMKRRILRWKIYWGLEWKLMKKVKIKDKWLERIKIRNWLNDKS